MKDAALIYRPPAKWRIITAFCAAIVIHLAAVALASHRAVSSPGMTAPVIADISGVDEFEPAPPIPEIDDAMAAPPAPPLTDFVEDKTPRPALSRPTLRPIHSATAARSAGFFNPRALAVRAPRPEYPYEARSRHITGSGVVALQIDEPTGAVIGVKMEPSVGNSILDQSALSAFRRWRFKPGTPSRVRVPVTFTLTGAQL